MNDVIVSVEREKCQGFGACVRHAPEAFVLDDRKRATLLDGHSVSDDRLLKAARSCPYKAIVVVGKGTNEQLHPRRYR